MNLLFGGRKPTFVMGPEWPWYSTQSFWRGKGYLMALTVPLEVPVKMTLPERDMAMAVWATSSAGTSLRICEKISIKEFELAFKIVDQTYIYIFLLCIDFWGV